MGAVAGFEHILDEKLAAARPDPVAPPASFRQPVALHPDIGLRFVAWGGGVTLHAATTAYRTTARPPGAEPPPPAGHHRAVPRPAAPSSVPRVPSLAGLPPLECLRVAGSTGLDADCTLAELKRAFRSLAKRYHPDSHPGASEHERGQLDAAFARIAVAYRQLAARTSKAA